MAGYTGRALWRCGDSVGRRPGPHRRPARRPAPALARAWLRPGRRGSRARSAPAGALRAQSHPLDWRARGGGSGGAAHAMRPRRLHCRAGAVGGAGHRRDSGELGAAGAGAMAVAAGTGRRAGVASRGLPGARTRGVGSRERGRCCASRGRHCHSASTLSNSARTGHGECDRAPADWQRRPLLLFAGCPDSSAASFTRRHRDRRSGAAAQATAAQRPSRRAVGAVLLHRGGRACQ